MFTPCARIVHVDGGRKSTSQVSIKMFVQMQKSSMIYHRKNLGIAAWASVKGIYIASNTIRMVLWLGSSAINRDKIHAKKSAAAKAALRYHFLGVEPE